MNKNKLNRGRMLAFASTDIFGGGSFNIINFLYPGFLALTIGVPAEWAGIIILIARVWDAITDPIMGAISDRTQSKLGKRRIYLVVASPLVVLALFLLFYPFQFDSLALRIIASLFTYLLFATVQTMVMIPYYSLSSEISTDYEQRARANAYRLGFSIFSSILCVALPKLIVEMYQKENSSNPTGYIVMGLIFGSIFAISVLITGLFAREEIKTPPLKSKVDFKGFVKPLKLKTYRQYLWMFMTLQVTMAIMSGLFFFYIDFIIVRDITEIGGKNIVGMIGAALMFMMQIVALPVYLKMIRLKNKMFVYRFGAYIWIVGAIFLFFLPANVNPIYVYLLAIILGFGISAPGLIPHTILGDVVDSSELILKERAEGSISGLTNFANKISQAIGLGLVMIILGIFDFKEAEPGQVVNSQPESAQMVLRIIIAFAPLLFMSIGIFVSKKYKIDYEMQKRIIQALENRKQGIEDEQLIKELCDEKTK
ncbi:MAG: MFS transporter [Bacilli bacterium]